MQLRMGLNGVPLDHLAGYKGTTLQQWRMEQMEQLLLPER